MRAASMRTRQLPIAMAALAAALMSVLGGCSSGSGRPATHGPLSSGVGGTIPRGAICAPGGELQTFGVQVFTNYGHTTVVLDRVALLDPNHERLIGSYAVPGTLMIGTVPWPPRYQGMPSTWKFRKPVRGFRVAPGKSFNMVLGVTATTTGQATSQGMLVYYHDPAGSYVAKNYFANIIAAVKSHC
jgi:hypothetical protein